MEQLHRMVRLRIGDNADVNALFDDTKTKEFLIRKSVKWSASFASEAEDGKKHPDIRITFSLLAQVLSSVDDGTCIDVPLVTRVFRNSILELPLRVLLQIPTYEFLYILNIFPKMVREPGEPSRSDLV